MEETLKIGVCLGCRRRRFDVRATQVGDETRELCPKCRRGPAGAAEGPVATLVPETAESLAKQISDNVEALFAKTITPDEFRTRSVKLWDTVTELGFRDAVQRIHRDEEARAEYLQLGLSHPGQLSMAAQAGAGESQ